jgi:Carbohydrate-binding family 9
MIAAMSSDTLVVRRAEFSIEDPWSVPPGCDPVPLRLATDGSAPRLATAVAAYFDDETLTIIFTAADDGIVATHVTHDAPLYEEDVVEAFLSPDTLTEYYEIEVNPLGTTFDARISSPDGDRTTMQTDLAWKAGGMAAVRKLFGDAGSIDVDTVMRIPFASMGRATPRTGETWRANFFRIDRHPAGAEFSAWQPTNKTPPDFHVPNAFGTLRFE